MVDPVILNQILRFLPRQVPSTGRQFDRLAASLCCTRTCHDAGHAFFQGKTLKFVFLQKELFIVNLLGEIFPKEPGLSWNKKTSG